MRKGIRKFTLVLLLMGLLTGWARYGMAQGAGATSSLPRTPAPKAIPKLTSHRRLKRTTSGLSKTRRTPVGPSSLWLISKPPNCKVLSDGVLQGETNAEGELELKLDPGTHTIRVTREGYVTSEGEVDVVATSDATEVEFTLAPAVTSVNVVTNPTEAEVYIDDIYKGASNGNGLLVIERINPSQSHTLRVAKAGYQSQTVPITTYAGQISIA